ncbi:hypothetical protein [Streptomyces sp. PT12]|uniref:hypothetical protein n=1 Tax=Streptomyces sp. PT12 TaxID=1510197 RepID=UPI000DE43E23|nr:hypothetical protein [Streptomyces sp. PT12]RBM16641.1 hypothetical protein DEH69_16430 [Streptomyces sp. PT12]
MDTMERETATRERIFDEVHIGKGVRPIAQHGYVTVAHGHVTLRGSDRRRIAGAPLSRVEASRVRFTGGKTLALRIDGTRYNVSPRWGDRSGRFLRPGPGHPEDVERAAGELLRLIESGGAAA